MRFRTMVPAVLGLALLLLPTAAAAAPAPRGLPTTPAAAPAPRGLAATPATEATPPGRATTPAAPPTPTVSVTLTLNVCLIEGNATSVPGDTMTVEHRSASGKLRRKVDVSTTGGAWQLTCPGPALRIGDKLRFFTTGATTPFRSFVVPKLQLRPDRVHDHLRGNAPGGADTVQVAVHRCDPSLSICSKSIPVAIPVAPTTGAFDIATGDMTGATLTRLIWRKGADFVQLHQSAARMVVRPGSATVTGYGGRTGQSVSLSVRRGQATGLANPTTRPDASFKGAFKKGGSPMKVRAGDLVSGSFAGDATLRVPVTSLTFDGDSIDGQCFKNAPVTVVEIGTDGVEISTNPASSDSTGHWTVAWTPLAGVTIRAWCGTPKGDAVLNELVAI
ncbi:MAG: hypothetical protein U0869_19635 [Chloroflexota bacterium]